jgi:AbiU2
MQSAPSALKGIMEVVGPVWLNTYWVENALGICEGIWSHANEINAEHRHFFGLTSKYATDAAVLGICRLYDTSNPKYRKDTVFSLLRHFKNNFSAFFPVRLRESFLVELGASGEIAQRIVACLHSSSDISEKKEGIISLLDRHVPRPNNNSCLKLLFTHRDKVIAHQEQLSTLSALLKSQLKFLPSLAEMESLNNWAMSLCRLVVTGLSNETLLPHPVSARIAALNVIAKVLGKNFNPHGGAAAYQEWEAFYQKPE